MMRPVSKIVQRSLYRNALLNTSGTSQIRPSQVRPSQIRLFSSNFDQNKDESYQKYHKQGKYSLLGGLTLAAAAIKALDPIILLVYKNYDSKIH